MSRAKPRSSVGNEAGLRVGVAMTGEIEYSILLLVQGAANGFMVGVIWFVQVVHYPLFHDVGREAASGYAIAHQARTSWLVVPPMLVEAASLALLLLVAPPSEKAILVWMTVLLVGVWLSTFLLQVPRHRRLLNGSDRRLVAGLVASNWARTALWSAKGMLCGWLVARAMAHSG